MRRRGNYVLDFQGRESINAVKPIPARFFFREPVAEGYYISFRIFKVPREKGGEERKNTSHKAKLPNVLEPCPLMSPRRLG